MLIKVLLIIGVWLIKVSLKPQYILITLNKIYKTQENIWNFGESKKLLWGKRDIYFNKHFLKKKFYDLDSVLMYYI